jgi:hypothetical protein
MIILTMENTTVSNEQLICTLKDRYTWLKIRLEATAHQIEILGGDLNFHDKKFFKSLKIDKSKFKKEFLLEHEWIDKVVDALHQTPYPISLKEIAEIIFSQQDLLMQSSIYNKTKKAMAAMIQHGLASKSIGNKYILKTSFKSN